jgi:membrane protein DedA with SNARE-associated domain/membrane-associated phospholipid phosphatase
VKHVREHKGLVAIAVVVAATIALYQAGVIPHLPDVQKLIEDLAGALGKWTYLLVGGLAFLETGAGVGLVAPGETAVIIGGVVAGQGEISLVLLLGLVWVCCVLGDVTSFFIGRRLGRDFLVRHGPKIKIDTPRLEQVESYFQRHGGKTILIGRFIGLVRALAPFIAGSSGLAFRRFIPFSIIGCGLWATLYTLLGYFFWQSFDQVAGIAGKATLVFASTVATIVVIVLLVRAFRDPERRSGVKAWLDRQSRRPLLRPLAAVIRPLWRVAAPRVRFLFDRLTPGELGLELTTALAVSGVGWYVFILYAVIFTGDVTITPFDRSFHDLAGNLYNATAVDIAKAITALGSFTAVFFLVLVASVVLASRRYFTELVTLLTGVVLLYIGVHLAKNGIDRTRPPDGVIAVSGSSYPSGHAAYSMLWIGVAVLLSRTLPGIVRSAAVITASIVLAALIGLTRIYLRVHYWSDVAGGWGLGAGVLGGCAAVALIVAYIRNNEGTEPEASPPPGTFR